jgi:hypothetical protein
VKEWGMEEYNEAWINVQSSYTMSVFTYPDNHCYRRWKDDREYGESLLVAEVLFGETTVTMFEIMDGFPMRHSVDEYGREVPRAVSDLADMLGKTNISSVVLAGELSDASAHMLKLEIGSAVPSLKDKFKNPATSFRHVAVVGAACEAQVYHLRDGHHDEL